MGRAACLPSAMKAMAPFRLKNLYQQKASSFFLKSTDIPAFPVSGKSLRCTCTKNIMRFVFLLANVIVACLQAPARDTVYYRSHLIETGDAASCTYHKVTSRENPVTGMQSVNEYYRSGTLKSAYTLLHGKETGKTTEYYENGRVHDEVRFEGVQVAGINSYWKPGQTKRVELYRNGSVESGKCYNLIGKEIPFFPFEEEAQYPGGEEALFAFLAKNINYPREAQQKNIQGRVVIGFVIDEDGKVDNLKVMHGVRSDMDEEAMRVIRLMPAWKPARQDGINCNQAFTLPIEFQL